MVYQYNSLIIIIISLSGLAALSEFSVLQIHVDRRKPLKISSDDRLLARSAALLEGNLFSLHNFRRLLRNYLYKKKLLNHTRIAQIYGPTSVFFTSGFTVTLIWISTAMFFLLMLKLLVADSSVETLVTPMLPLELSTLAQSTLFY